MRRSCWSGRTTFAISSYIHVQQTISRSRCRRKVIVYIQQIARRCTRRASYSWCRSRRIIKRSKQGIMSRLCVDFCSKRLGRRMNRRRRHIRIRPNPRRGPLNKYLLFKPKPSNLGNNRVLPHWHWLRIFNAIHPHRNCMFVPICPRHKCCFETKVIASREGKCIFDLT